jgi:hypothetical protein
MRGQKAIEVANTAGMRLYKVSLSLEVCFVAPEVVDAATQDQVTYRAREAIASELACNEHGMGEVVTTLIDKPEDIPADWAGAIPWTPDNTLAQPIETLLEWITS